MTEWDGQPYSAVVVASSSYVVLRIGAIYGNHDEWNGEDSDSRVENSLRSFKYVASLLIACMKTHLKQRQINKREKHLQTGAMLRYLAGLEYFPAPLPKKSARTSTELSIFRKASCLQTLLLIHKIILRRCRCCWWLRV